MRSSGEDKFLNEELKAVQVSGRLRTVTAYSTHPGNSDGQCDFEVVTVGQRVPLQLSSADKRMLKWTLKRP